MHKKILLTFSAITVDGKPIFNENPNMQAPPQTYSTEGLTLDYQRASDAAIESINIDGPIQTEAEAQVSLWLDFIKGIHVL